MKKKTLSMAFLIFGAFVALTLISEWLYIFKGNSGNPEAKKYFYLQASSLFARASLVEPSLEYLKKAAEIELEKTITIPDIPENAQLKNAFLRYLRDLNPSNLGNLSNQKWAKIFYTFGLFAHKTNAQELTVAFWHSAVSIAPEWSYFHIELANLYSQRGQTEKAHERLQNCLQFENPKIHCQQYIDRNLDKGFYEEVGFLEATIHNKIQ